ncbi:MAG: patatin-like phospholipase family protein [Firmicutes bacterium]|nr:patatin-like phospholipase family protein [Bacillota bacterium]
MSAVAWRAAGRAPARPALGLALGAGGLRGLAHVGVLKALVEASLPPGLLAGSSMGAVVGALYAAGWSPEAMESLARSLEARRLYDLAVGPARLGAALARWLLGRARLPNDWLPPYPLGLIRGERLRRLLEEWLGRRRFEELEVPLAVVATDLTHGRRVVFASPVRARVLARSLEDAAPGPRLSVAEAVRASTAIPGLFEPLIWEGRLLVDGGVLDAVPVDVVRAMGARVVVAVDLGFAGGRPVRSAFDVGVQAIELMGEALTRPTVERHATLVLRPRVREAGLTDFASAAEIIRQGYEEARRALPALRRALGAAGPAGPAAGRPERPLQTS